MHIWVRICRRGVREYWTSRQCRRKIGTWSGALWAIRNVIWPATRQHKNRRRAPYEDSVGGEMDNQCNTQSPARSAHRKGRENTAWRSHTAALRRSKQIWSEMGTSAMQWSLGGPSACFQPAKSNLTRVHNNKGENKAKSMFRG